MSDTNEIRKFLEKHIEESTPTDGNKCKTESCGGEVVKKVHGLFHGRFIYSTPECVKCGRTYTRAENVRSMGEKEFWKMLNQPFTI